MKKILIVIVLFTLFFTFCEDDINNNDNNNIITTTSLKISNHSSYNLKNVNYASVNFGDLNIGSNKTMDLNADNIAPIYFEIDIHNNPILFKTNELITCNKGITEKAILDTTVVTGVGIGDTGTLKNVYERLNKPQPLLDIKCNNSVVEYHAEPIDFGQVSLGASKNLIFIIKNVGNLQLELTGSPLISSTNSVFFVSQPVNKLINPGSTVQFTIQYTPASENEEVSIITIPNNTEGLIFTFNVKGKGYISKPKINIKQGTVNIDQNSEYNFSNVLYNNKKEVAFSIYNSGDANLTIASVNSAFVNLADNSTGYFVVTQQPLGAVINPGDSRNFIITFNPTVIGNNFSALVSIKSNCSVNEDFSFHIKGNGIGYSLGETGPAGGLIFYDKGYLSDGWRFLEASPATTEFKDVKWGALSTNITGTSVEIGTGKQNTQIIISRLNQLSETGKAAQVCNNLNYNGYNDWFLPSKNELDLMYQNLKKNNLGGFSNDYLDCGYWSSSQADSGNVWLQYFDDGTQNSEGTWSSLFSNKDYSIRVRAVRSF